MKVILLAVALLFTLPLTVNADPIGSYQWYKTHNPGSWVDMYQRPGYRQGRLMCRVPHGETVHAQGYLNSVGQQALSKDGKYVLIKWRKYIGVAEWHWRDGMNGLWCPLWNRKGWVEKRLLREIPTPGNWRWWMP